MTLLLPIISERLEGAYRTVRRRLALAGLWFFMIASSFARALDSLEDELSFWTDSLLEEPLGLLDRIIWRRRSSLMILTFLSIAALYLLPSVMGRPSSISKPATR